MTLVTDLDLPAFDYTDADLHGPRFHATMRELRAQGWLAATPLGYVVLEREAAGFFLRSRSAEFPGMKIAEIFGIEDGPLYEEMRRNILHINGADHARLRGLVNPSFTPRAAERWRPAMRGFMGELLDAALADERRRRLRQRGREAVPVARDRDRAGRAAGGRAAAARVVELGAAAVRRADADGRAAAHRAQRRRAVRLPRRAARGAARRPRRRPHLAAARGARRGRRPPLRRGAREPRARRADRRDRHDAVAARARAAAARRAPGAVGAAARRTRRRARRGRRGGAALRADHALHRAHPDRGRRVPRRVVPAGHGAADLRPHARTATATARRRVRHRGGARRRADRSRSAPASTTASARTSREPSCRRACA